MTKLTSKNFMNGLKNAALTITLSRLPSPILAGLNFIHGQQHRRKYSARWLFGLSYALARHYNTDTL